MKLAAVFAPDLWNPFAWEHLSPEQRQQWLIDLFRDLKQCGITTMFVHCPGETLDLVHSGAAYAGVSLIPRINSADGKVWGLKTDDQREAFRKNHCRLWSRLPRVPEAPVVTGLWWSDDLAELPPDWRILYDALKEHGALSLWVTPPVRYLGNFGVGTAMPNDWPSKKAPQVHVWAPAQLTAGAGLRQLCRNVDYLQSLKASGICLQTFGSPTAYPHAPPPGATRISLEMCAAAGLNMALLFTPIFHHTSIPDGAEGMVALYDPRLLKDGLEAARTWMWHEVKQFAEGEK